MQIWKNIKKLKNILKFENISWIAKKWTHKFFAKLTISIFWKSSWIWENKNFFKWNKQTTKRTGRKNTKKKITTSKIFQNVYKTGWEGGSKVSSYMDRRSSYKGRVHFTNHTIFGGYTRQIGHTSNDSSHLLTHAEESELTRTTLPHDRFWAGACAWRGVPVFLYFFVSVLYFVLHLKNSF